MEICCSKCAGKGKIPMPRHLQETVDYLRTNPGSTPLEIRDAIEPRISVTGINNRLDDLEKLGFAVREKTDGKQFKWSLKNG